MVAHYAWMSQFSNATFTRSEPPYTTRIFSNLSGEMVLFLGKGTGFIGMGSLG